MKNTILIFVFVLVLANWGCRPERTPENKKASVEALRVEEVRLKDLADKRALLTSGKLEKAEQRRLALLKKVKHTPSFTDAHGNIVYYDVDIAPAYLGGNDAITQYLKENIKYPAHGVNEGYEGTVFVDFIVDSRGHIRDVVATDVVGDDVDIAFEEESVRVISAMTGWMAGVHNGRSVDVLMSMPVTFRLDN